MRPASANKTRVLGALLAFVFCTLAAGGAFAGELITNGSFETGDFTGWVHGAFRGGNNNPNLADHVVVADLPYTGSYSALLGFKYANQTTEARGYMYQDVTIPANVSSAVLFFKIRQQGYDSTPYDPFVAQIRQTDNTVLQTVLQLTFPEYNFQFKDSGWLDDDNTIPVGVDMSGYAGQTVRIYFEQANTIDALYETWAFVDDVSLQYTQFVDLIVDGDGGDLFGNPGTGAGGFAATTGLPGDTLAFDLTVENEGIDNDSYDLTLTPPAGWSAWIEVGGVLQPVPYTTGVIAPGASAGYRVILVPPIGTSVGTYDVVLDALSTTFGTRFDSATLRSSITAATYGSDLVVDGNGFGVIGAGGAGGFALKQAPRDTTVTYALELRNTGDAPADFDVSFTTDPAAQVTIWLGGTPYTTPFATPVVPAGGSLMLVLDVTVLSPNPGDDYETIVTASSVPDPLRRDTIRAILRVLAPRVDMIIGANGDDIYDGTGSGLGGTSSNAGERGASVLFPLIIQNESSIADSFQLDWTGPGWNAFIVDGGVDQNFPFTTAVIPPYSQIAYVLKIDIPGGAAYATFPSILEATSLVDTNITESVTASVSVSETVEIDMVIDGSGTGVYGPLETGLGGSSTQTLSPGDSVTFNIDLVNNAGTNSIDVTWNTPPGWVVTFDGQTAPVIGYPAGTYPLKVVVPASSLGGTFDIIIDGNKNAKPFYVDSVLGRVIVLPPVVVDAIIDGNGDEVFGATGTGLGGSSAQTHSAPATLSYTVELQNQGAVDDQYTMTWNTIAGWNATIAAGSSPLTTPVVTAGGFTLLTMQVTVPAGAVPGNYTYIVDVVSNTDPATVESFEAVVTVVGPPYPDFVIDGNGAGIFGALDSGAGGLSIRGADPGDFFTAALDLTNIGSFADSFYVDWKTPAGWPAGSVLINDGSTSHAAPFWSPVVGPGLTAALTVEVQVPVTAGLGLHETIVNTYSALPPNTPESAKLVTQTAAVVTGFAFEDRDHDGVLTAGDRGLAGVRIDETTTGATGVTGGAGEYTIWVPGGTSATVIERNLSGFVSLSPDTVGPNLVAAGDTLRVDFADVIGLRLTPGSVLNGFAGGYVDFPHRLQAGTIGQVSLTPMVAPSAVTMFLLDANGNGVFDTGDRALQPSDLDMDPPSGIDAVTILLRVFIPLDQTVGTTIHVTLSATQIIGATALTSMAQANDAVIVVNGQIGRVTLQKQVDTGSATPGQVITYSISFLNTGADSVRNIIILDPMSPFVDPVPDTFGPGLDVEWVRAGMGPQYLTLDPLDADECEYSGSERLLRLILSKNSPFYLQPGETGTLIYRAVVK